MSCPKGFKHLTIHPRPNRRKRETRMDPARIHPPEGMEACLSPDDESVCFSTLDEVWMREIGILP